MATGQWITTKPSANVSGRTGVVASRLQTSDGNCRNNSDKGKHRKFNDSSELSNAERPLLGLIGMETQITSRKVEKSRKGIKQGNTIYEPRKLTCIRIK